MRVSRRSVVALSTGALSCAAFSRISGAEPARSSADAELSRRLINAMPRQNYYDILLRLSDITQKGSTGESFNSRWRKARNPLIEQLFHDVG